MLSLSALRNHAVATHSHMSRRLALFASLALAACAFPPKGNAQEVLDGIAAVVNDDVITFSQVRDLVGPIEKAARDQLKGNELVEKIKEIRLKAINDLIDRQLALQEFKKQKQQDDAEACARGCFVCETSRDWNRSPFLDGDSRALLVRGPRCLLSVWRVIQGRCEKCPGGSNADQRRVPTDV